MNHHEGHQHGEGSEHDADMEHGTTKPGGLGPDGTIPPEPEGLGATTTDEESTFEPEEDEAAPDRVRKPDVP